MELGKHWAEFVNEFLAQLRSFCGGFVIDGCLVLRGSLCRGRSWAIVEDEFEMSVTRARERAAGE